jgi:hypothetical protein
MLADHFVRVLRGSGKWSSVTSRPRPFSANRTYARGVMFASAARRSNCMCPTALKSARRAPTKAGAGGARAGRATRWRLRQPSDGFAMKSARTGIGMDIKGVVQRRVSSWRLNASKCFIARGRKECPGLDKPGLWRAALHLALGPGLCRGSHGGENLMGRRNRNRRHGDRRARAIRRVGGVGDAGRGPGGGGLAMGARALPPRTMRLRSASCWD